MDSSDWDQTQERFGSQGGGQKATNTNSTESPESVLNTRSNTAPSTSEAQRLISNSGGGTNLPQTEEFIPRYTTHKDICTKAQLPSADPRSALPWTDKACRSRDSTQSYFDKPSSNPVSITLGCEEFTKCRDGSGSNLAAEQPADHHPQSYSRLLGLEDEPMGRNAGNRGDSLWEGRGSTGNIFHNQPFPMANQGTPMHGGLAGGENRGVAGRDSWGSDEMAGKKTCLL